MKMDKREVNNVSIYYIPKDKTNSKTQIMIAGYEIVNPTFSENLEPVGESQLILHLNFISNDYSPNKFTKFLDAFNNFLQEYNRL